MESTANNLETLFEKAEIYGKTTFELSKLKAINASSTVLTNLISKLIIASTLLIFIMVLNIGIALYVGDLMGKAYFGFLVVAAFYLFMGLLMKLFLFKLIRKPLSNLIITLALR